MTSRSVQRPGVSPAPESARPTPLAPVTDEQALVARIRSGDRRAFEEIFDRYAASLIAFARSQVGSTEAAEEIVQDIFFAVWVARERWIVRRSVRAYLCQAVHNRALNYHRNGREERRRLASFDESPMVEQCAAPDRSDGQLTDAELREAIAQATGALPERNRQVFHLVREQGLTYPEVAEILGITVKSVEAHMHRAARALRDALAAWRS